MYESYFNLARRPFGATPDPDCFVPVESTTRALDDLVRCIEDGEGIGVLTAPAGIGKTLACRKLAAELGDTFATVLLANSNFATRRSLLQAILYELRHPYLRMAEQELRLELQTAARNIVQEREGILLIVDEAHLLSTRLLEEIRAITNLIDDGIPLVRVVLSGQLSLEEKLAEPALSSLNQRVACQVALAPFSLKESAEYVGRRLEWAGGRVAEIFAPDALHLICQASDGSPRCLNQLCDHALMLAYVAGEKPVGAETIHEALADLKQLPLHWNVPTPVASPIEQLEDEAERLRGAKSPRGNSGTSIAREDRRAVETRAVDADGANVSSIEFGGDEDDSVTAIEIGGSDEPQCSPSRPAVSQSSAPKLQAAAAAHTAASKQPANTAAELEEELVVDRYAALDANTAKSRRKTGFNAAARLPVNAPRPEAPVPPIENRTGDGGPSHGGSRANVPAAKQLDQTIEGLIQMIDDVLDTSHPAFDSSATPGITVETDAFDIASDLAVSVEMDPTGNLRVQSSGFTPPQPIVTVAEEDLAAMKPAPARPAEQRKQAFDVVLPETEDIEEVAEPASPKRAASNEAAAQKPPAGTPIPSRPHRTYEQLFSELRRKKGA